jgi:hypothetical protein
MSYPNNTMQLAPLVQSQFIPGQDNVSRILNGVRTGFITLEITATLTVAVATATGILNDGSLAALFTRVVFYENGNFIVQRDARSMSRMTELLGFAPSSNIRMSSTLTAAAYALREHIVIPFAWPLGVNPWETCFVAIDQNAPNTVGLTAKGGATSGWTAAGAATGNGVIVTPGSSGTAAITLLNVNIVQEFDTDLGILPLFRPYMQDLVSQPFVGAVVDQAFYIDYPDTLRSLMIQQDTDVGVVGDIITAYQFRTDTTTIDGNGNDLTFADQVQMLVRKFAGAISAGRIARAANPYVDPGYLFRNFQSSGRLSNVLVRAQIGQNVRLLITGAGSGSGTSGTSVVRAGMDRLQKIAGVTNPANVTSQGQKVPV